MRKTLVNSYKKEVTIYKVCKPSIADRGVKIAWINTENKYLPAALPREGILYLRIVRGRSTYFRRINLDIALASAVIMVFRLSADELYVPARKVL